MGLVAAPPLIDSLSAAVLLAGLAVAAAFDWRRREVSDHLWQLLGLLGLALGAAAALGGGMVAVLLWLVVGAFVLQHLFAWDEALERRWPAGPAVVEIAMYVGVGLVLLVVGLSAGLGAQGLSIPILAVYLSVVGARALFESGVLYGGADAKAVMVCAILVPVDPRPWLALPGPAVTGLDVLPFVLSLLMDSALLALAIPIGLAARNAARGEFEFPRGFTSFLLDVRALPDRFVWVRDPRLPVDAAEVDVDSTEEDEAVRRRQAEQLQARGIARVWVSPQVPFVVLLAAGAAVALLMGNLLFDLLALL